MQHDIIHVQGKAYVLVPLHEYRHLQGHTAPASALPEDILDQLYARAVHPVKILRKYRGLTQADLAEKSGISRPYLAEIETGRKEGSVTALKNLAAALQTDINSII
ncbi:MAG TPA: helix-turn-helix transcriptional regulator [Micavibrio sp.]